VLTLYTATGVLCPNYSAHVRTHTGTKNGTLESLGVPRPFTTAGRKHHCMYLSYERAEETFGLEVVTVLCFV
jgi:hypothetical protein